MNTISIDIKRIFHDQRERERERGRKTRKETNKNKRERERERESVCSTLLRYFTESTSTVRLAMQELDVIAFQRLIHNCIKSGGKHFRSGAECKHNS